MSFIQKIQLGFEPRPVNIRIHYVSYYTIEYGIMIILILTLIYIYQRNRHTQKTHYYIQTHYIPLLTLPFPKAFL